MKYGKYCSPVTMEPFFLEGHCFRFVSAHYASMGK